MNKSMTQPMMASSGFSSRGQLLRQARQDASWNLEMVAENSGVNVDKLKALESDNQEAILIAKVTTVDLRRLEELFRLPDSTLLREENPYLHRMVVFQQFVTPRGFHAWTDLFHRFAAAHLIPDEDGVLESSALAKLREDVENQLKKRVVKLAKENAISQGRAKELLNLTAWDDLPTE